MRKVTLPFLVAALLAAPAVFAQSTIRFEPPDPTSQTPITLIVTEFDTCPPSPVVTRSESLITVTLGTGGCLSPPIEITYRIEIGTLPTGQYEVIVTDNGMVAASAVLTVLDAKPSVTVQPSLGPSAGGTTVVIVASVPRCVTCPPPTITFGGVPAPDVTVLDATTFRATTPPHAPGAVEVRVTTDMGEQHSHAFRYYDPAAAPLPALFERVLIPIVYNGPGAHGSIWATELAVRNANAFGVTLWRPTRGLPVIPSSKAQTLDLDQAPSGVFLTVPHEASAALHMNLLVRDTSREMSDWGTEVPIVRANDFSAVPFELLNVPVDSRYRTTLRIYLLGSYPVFARVVLYSMVNGGTLAADLISLSSAEPCPGVDPCNSDKPSFAIVNDLPKTFRLGTSDRIGIRIEPWIPVPMWAFLTITNNETQRVTVISPQ